MCVCVRRQYVNRWGPFLIHSQNEKSRITHSDSSFMDMMWCAPLLPAIRYDSLLAGNWMITSLLHTMISFHYRFVSHALLQFSPATFPTPFLSLHFNMTTFWQLWCTTCDMLGTRENTGKEKKTESYLCVIKLHARWYLSHQLHTYVYIRDESESWLKSCNAHIPTHSLHSSVTSWYSHKWFKICSFFNKIN